MSFRCSSFSRKNILPNNPVLAGARVTFDKGACLCGEFVRDGENVGYGAGWAPGMEIEARNVLGHEKSHIKRSLCG